MNLTIRLRYIIISLLFLIFIALVYTFRAVLPTFILALLLAYILTPVVVKISSKKIFRRKIPRGMAIIVIYVLLCCLLSTHVCTLDVSDALFHVFAGWLELTHEITAR